MDHKSSLSLSLQEWLGESRKLRHKVAKLLLKQDELRFLEGIRVENQYMLLLGDLEIKLAKAFHEAKRMEGILEAVLKKEATDMEAVQASVEANLETSFQKIEHLLYLMQRAEAWEEKMPLNTEERIQLKQLYRSFIRKFHPQLYPEQSEREKALFLKACRAFQEEDIETLNILLQALSGEASSPFYGPKEEREEEFKRLEELSPHLEAEIAKMNYAYPLVLRCYLEDEEAFLARKAELEKKLSKYNKEKEQYIESMRDCVKMQNLWLN